MNRSIGELEDLRYQLDTTVQVFSRPAVNDRAFEAWLEALETYKTAEIIAALKTYVRENDYAPRPKSIADLCTRERERGRGFQPPKPDTNVADPRIAKAWVICIRRFHGFGVTDANPDVELDFETALEIVNREAMKHDMPESIPDAFKLQAIWAVYDQQGINF